MKRSLAPLLFTMALFTSPALIAQSADQIIDRYYEAIGGKDAWRNINTLKMEASVDVQGNEIPVVIYQANNKALKSEVNFNGTTNYNLVTTEGGWKYFPIMGQTSPEPMTEEEILAGKEGLDIQGDLLDYTGKGHKVEYLGTEKMDNNDLHKLKLIRKSGTEITYFIDPKTHFMVKAIFKFKGKNEVKEQVQNMSNYQKVDGGIMVPFTLEGAGPGVIIISKVEVNPVIEDSVFKLAQ